jgi:hypothetical protein
MGASVVAVSRGAGALIGALGLHGRSREWPQRTLFDVSAHLRNGRYQVRSTGGSP